MKGGAKIVCKNITTLRIKGLIETHGISQKDFAASIGIRHEAISRYLNGKSKPGLNTIMKIADTYNVNPAWLLGYSEEAHNEK